MRILLVEDDPLVAMGIASTLTDAGHEVRWAINGVDGLKALAPDVIFTDRRMPGMNGLEFAKAARTTGLANQAPLVLLSGHIGDLSASESAPFALILAKPISPENLLARVEESAAIPC